MCFEIFAAGTGTSFLILGLSRDEGRTDRTDQDATLPCHTGQQALWPALFSAAYSFA